VPIDDETLTVDKLSMSELLVIVERQKWATYGGDASQSYIKKPMYCECRLTSSSFDSLPPFMWHNVSDRVVVSFMWHNVSDRVVVSFMWHNVSDRVAVSFMWHNVSDRVAVSFMWHNVSDRVAVSFMWHNASDRVVVSFIGHLNPLFLTEVIILMMMSTNMCDTIAGRK
jgi:hypothetical protein